MSKYILFSLLLFGFFGCTEIEKIVKKETPHEQYERMLHESGLLETELGRAWVRASENALNDSLTIQLPYKEEAYFFNDKATAFSYGFSGRRGESISININKDSTENYKIFIDVFKLRDEPELEAFAERGETQVQFEPDEDGEYLVRIQPELLKGGSFTLLIQQSASLAFPVIDKDSRAIGSVWGDVRDGGRRSHEGVDIFAPRHTPVVAVTDGFISRTGTNRLGGKVVWLLTTGKSFYYAHLDSQIVSPGTYVNTGDTLGLVGNTGNAVTTPPHLHFGIYSHGEGAIDPYPFIRNVFPDPQDVRADTSLIGEWGRVKTASTYVRSAPGTKEAILQKLNRSAPFIVYGASSSWYKIKLPDGSSGFIQSTSVESAQRPVNNLSVNDGEVLKANLNDIFISLPHKENETFTVHGRYKNLTLINYKSKLVMVEI